MFTTTLAITPVLLSLQSSERPRCGNLNNQYFSDQVRGIFFLHSFTKSLFRFSTDFVSFSDPTVSKLLSIHLSSSNSLAGFFPNVTSCLFPL